MSIENILSTAFLVPMGNPEDPKCRWGLNVMLWGEPGIGKSDRVEAAATRVGLPCRTTYVPTCQPEDAAGTAFMNTTKTAALIDAVILTLEEALDSQNIDEVNPALLALAGKDKKQVQRLVKNLADVTRRYGPSFARIEPLLPGVSDLFVDGQGVWFLDELSSARPAVQGGFLGATLARRVGGLQLPPGIRIVAAGNPPESAAGGWELEPPMANRFCHYTVATPSQTEWSQWLLNEDSFHIDSIESGEQKVRAGWPKYWPQVKGLVTGFTQAKPTLLHALPKEGSKDRGKAWCSPRTWTFASRAIATCRCLDVDDSTTEDIITGCIGEGPATALLEWISKADLPSPDDALNNGWEIDKRRLDRCWAVFTSMVAFVLSRPTKEDKAQYAVKMWNRLNEAKNASLLDLVLPMADSLVKANLDTKHSPEMAAAAHPVMLELAKKGYARYLA